MVVEMTYNSARRDLVIPEYGRTIQEMVDHLKSITLTMAAAHLLRSSLSAMDFK